MKRLLCVILVCAALCGCGKQETKFDQSLFCMGTVMDIQIWGMDADSIADDVFAALRDLEEEWNAESETSAIAALNRGEHLNDEQAALVERIEALCQRTHGAFDPRLYAVTKLWGFPTGEYTLPTLSALDSAMEQQQWDLSGAMMGYAGDRCVEVLKQRGASRAFLSMGGNIQTYGEKPDGTPWKIGIRSPRNSGTAGTVCVTGTMSISTSSDDQQYFMQSGKRYCHIIDPSTGRPVQNDLASVTVISEDGLTADVLSTALFVMGLEEATEFWQESPDFQAVFILTSGEIYATEGTNLTDCEYEVIPYEN